VINYPDTHKRGKSNIFWEKTLRDTHVFGVGMGMGMRGLRVGMEWK
jgi:hypothetical protein